MDVAISHSLLGERGRRVWPRVVLFGERERKIGGFMAKVYNEKKNEIWWEDDIVGVVEDAWFEVLDVLNAKRQLDGHAAKDQWLMKVEVRLRDLINTLNDNPIPTQELLSYKQIL